MTDLQIGLAMLGVAIVVAVVAFNWWQERQFRRRSEQTFPGQHDDVLLGDGGRPLPVSRPVQQDDSARIEPRMEPEMETQLPAQAETKAQALTQQDGSRDIPRGEIDFIAELRSGEVISVDKIAGLQKKLSAFARRISLAGLDHLSKAWEPLRTDGRYSAVRIALQLVDRSGPVDEIQLRAFGEAIANAAGELGANAELPDLAPEIERALALDAFCAEVDVLVGISVIADSGQVFHGTKIRALAEASGLRLQSSGVFHCHDEQGVPLFALDNQQSEPFLIDRIRNITTPGITFLLDVPRVADGPRVFDKMVAMSRSFADSLSGTLADDNRNLLNDAGLDRIRAQLRAIYTAMEKHGIEAGSPVALRLFS